MGYTQSAVKSPKTIIFDLDGTLYDCEHRRKYITQSPKDYDSFYNYIRLDPLILPTAEILLGFYGLGYNIVFVSGRRESTREDTIFCLTRDFKINEYTLYMRSDKDFRSDELIKRDIYNTYLKDLDILCVYDDRTRVVNMWRELGLTCYQVANGDF